MHERGDVRVPRAGKRARPAPREARPQRARAAPIGRLLAVDRGGGGEARVLHLSRGGEGVTGRGEGPRAIDGRDVRVQLPSERPRCGVVHRHAPPRGERSARVPLRGERVPQHARDRRVLVLRHVRVPGRFLRSVRSARSTSPRARAARALLRSSWRSSSTRKGRCRAVRWRPRRGVSRRPPSPCCRSPLRRSRGPRGTRRESRPRPGTSRPSRSTVARPRGGVTTAR